MKDKRGGVRGGGRDNLKILFFKNKFMKKILIIILALAILIPTSVHAFSFGDILNKFFQKSATPSTVKTNEATSTPLSTVEKELAKQKYENWQTAFDRGDISSIFNNSYNFYFSGEEMNYLIEQQLNSIINPPANQVKVVFEDGGLIKISGISKVKFLSGPFSVEGEFVPGGDKAYFKVSRARFYGIYFPTIIAESVIEDQLRGTIDFLYSSETYSKLNFEVGDDYLKLDYSR